MKPKNYQVPKRTGNPPTDGGMLLERQVSFKTHLLPPDLLERYNQIIPTFADDIHSEFLRESEFQRKERLEVIAVNKHIINGEIDFRRRAQQYAFSLSLIVFLIAAALGMFGHDWLAGVMATVDLFALVSVFFGVQHYGSKEKSEQPSTQLSTPNQAEDEE